MTNEQRRAEQSRERANDFAPLDFERSRSPSRVVDQIIGCCVGRRSINLALLENAKRHEELLCIPNGTECRAMEVEVEEAMGANEREKFGD